MGKLEVLRTELERAKESLHKRGLSYEGNANTTDDLMKAKPFEIAYQDVIEKIWPDNAWWEVTHYWDIFDAMMGGLSDEEVIDEIIKHVGPDYVDECKEACIRGAHVEKGHNMREYLEKFGDDYDDGKLWDYLKEDFESGRVDARKDIVYWYMEDLNGEWRYFETSTLNEAKEEKKLDEGTSNFGSGPEHFPLLVFYTMDEFYWNMHHHPDYPQEEQFENEDGEIDWDAFENAKEEFELKYDESNKICVLDEDAQERLENKLYDFNEESKRMAWDADVVDGEQQYGDNLSLEDVKVNIESGYYSAAYIDVEHEDYLEDLDEDFKAKQMERFTKLFQELKEEFGLTELSAGPMASNGERGYSIVNNESLKEEKQHDGKCPFCDSENIDFVDSDEDSEKHVCHDCGQDFLVHNDGHVTTRNNRPIEESHELDKDFSKKDADAIINWWKEVEDANVAMKWGYHIDNGDYDDIEALHAAMFDMLDDLKEKDASDLFNKGKKLYNKYALSKYNEDLQESCGDKELVDKLVAFGTCADEKEAKERVAKMSQEDKDEMCKSLKRQAQDHLLNDSLKEMYDDFVIEDKFIEYMKSKGVKNPKVFDKDGFFIDGVYEKYAQGVADTYLDGNIDWLDGLCNEERCFREDDDNFDNSSDPYYCIRLDDGNYYEEDGDVKFFDTKREAEEFRIKNKLWNSHVTWDDIATNESLNEDVEKIVSKYKHSFYNKDKNRVETGDKGEWEKIAKELNVSDDNLYGNEIDGYFIDLKKNESLEEKKSKKKYKIRYTGDPAKDVAFFNHAMGSDKGEASVEQSSVSLGEGFVGQEVDDFLGVVVEPEAVETLVISNIDADDYTEAFKGNYDDIDSNLLHCEYADFDVGGAVLVVNVAQDSDEWSDTYYDTLETLLEDYNGDEIKVVDVNTGETLFEGDKEDIDEDIKGLTFWSIDTPKYLCINAHCGEPDEDDEEESEDDNELKIEYWYDEEARDQGLGDMYFGEIEDEEDGKRIVRKMIDRDGFASAELQRGDKVLFGYDGESTWVDEDESLDEGASYRGMAYYEYKGCHVRETPSCFVATDEHGATLGDSKTKAGAEGIIDAHVEKKDEKLSKKRIRWQNDHDREHNGEKREEALKENEDLYALHVKVVDADTGKINKIDRLFVGSKKECDAKKKQLEETSPEDSHHNRNIYKVSKVK